MLTQGTEMSDGTDNIDDLMLSVRTCKRAVDDLEVQLSAAKAALAAASAAMTGSLGVAPPAGRKAYRDRDAIARIDVILMAMAAGADRMADVAAAARKLGRPLSPGTVYQLPYRKLTEKAGNGRRQLTPAGRDRLEAALERPECLTFYKKVRETLEASK